MTRSGLASSFTEKGFIAIPFLIASLLLAILLPGNSFAAERQTKKQPVRKEVVVTINDANLQTYFAKAEEQHKKGDQESAMRLYLKIYDYTKEVLTTVKAIKTSYEKVLSEPSVTQYEKEDILIKLKSIAQFTHRYDGIQDISAYRIGYIYAKRGDGERARKYLTEVMDSTPFSGDRDSLWMKAKTLLLGLYNLEGEF